VALPIGGSSGGAALTHGEGAHAGGADLLAGEGGGRPLEAAPGRPSPAKAFTGEAARTPTSTVALPPCRMGDGEKRWCRRFRSCFGHDNGGGGSCPCSGRGNGGGGSGPCFDRGEKTVEAIIGCVESWATVEMSKRREKPEYGWGGLGPQNEDVVR
jgi:hypothetical protein